MRDYGLQDLAEAGRAVTILRRDMPLSFPGAAAGLTADQQTTPGGYATYLYRAALRTATQGEG
jgi:hypothetical protein